VRWKRCATYATVQRFNAATHFDASTLANSMTIQINGHRREVANGVTVLALIESLGFTAGNVLVEHNGVALFAREFDRALLNPGDKLEFVRLAAGG
jgi:thiamine biosynthesis protein ThiS